MCVVRGTGAGLKEVELARGDWGGHKMGAFETGERWRVGRGKGMGKGKGANTEELRRGCRLASGFSVCAKVRRME